MVLRRFGASVPWVGAAAMGVAVEAWSGRLIRNGLTVLSAVTVAVVLIAVATISVVGAVLVAIVLVGRLGLLESRLLVAIIRLRKNRRLVALVIVSRSWIALIVSTVVEVTSLRDRVVRRSWCGQRPRLVV